MNYSRVAVGSTNPVKIAAVTHIIHQIWPAAEILAVAVASGVHAQPHSDDEAIQGATNRARQALAACGAELGIGLEGNVAESAYGLFNTGWAVVVDQGGVTGIGGSGRFLLPAKIAEAIRGGEELGPLMDQLSGEQNTRHRQGAFGIFTDDLITRQGALETALISALTRFLNPQYY
ncbi:MAG: inosine/xanthosine triphosphatase [Caldilineaceae bacterium]|nr:inosine/xanthosine triphosphatase [Caldilineaceae bacterium]